MRVKKNITISFTYEEYVPDKEDNGTYTEQEQVELIKDHIIESFSSPHGELSDVVVGVKEVE